ncbi:zinc-dependent alcohol dehydrogenase [Actinoplanes subglobosus]|uniref:Zinc-binding dehydrogenase n=1 Tax=Actinoplanes subglobosus TaxID=1547892 RepID=A0ABV8IPR5_9ACTN
MRAVVHDGGTSSVIDVPSPVRPPGWVRVRVLLAAICRTDVYAATGLLPLGGPRILGHELAGVVEEADGASAFSAGDHVSVMPLLPCGACKACADQARCAQPVMIGVEVDGAFADEMVVPEAVLVRVPAGLPLRRVALVEPMAATIAVLGAPIRPDQRGAVVGAGRIADLTVRVLRAHGFRIDHCERPGSGDGGYDFVVESAGNSAALAEAVHLVRPGGVVVLKSRPAEPVSLDVGRAVRNDILFAAVSYGSFDDAVDLVGAMDVDDLFGEILPIERFDEALAMSLDQPYGPKVFLTPTGRSS